MGKHQRRRQVIVSPALQHRIIRATALVPCLGLVLVTALVLFICLRVYNEAVQSGAELPSVIELFVVTILFTLSSGIYTVWSARRFSNRIAGPMYNLSKTLERYRSGDTSARLHLRRGDFLLDIQDDMNDFLDWIEEDPSQAAAADLDLASEFAPDAASDVGLDVSEVEIEAPPTQ